MAWFNSLEPTNASLSAYLYKAIWNKVFDHLKHKKIVNDYLGSLNEFMDEGRVETDAMPSEKEFAAVIENAITKG